MPEEKKDFKHIVRIANTDLDGNKQIINALRKIKGIDFMFSNMACSMLGVDKSKKAGHLSSSEVTKFDDFLKDPKKYGVPIWMLNRRMDVETGEDMHLLGSDLKFQKENDIKLLKKIKCYKGVRHSLGLPVRGQSTKSNFRQKKKKGSTLGVQRKSKGGKK